MSEKQLNFLQDDDPQEDYFCPKCFTKMARNFAMQINPESDNYDPETLGHKSSALLAIYILNDLQAPKSAMRQICDWYDSIQTNAITIEQEDKLKLLRWKQSTNAQAQPNMFGE